MLSGFCFNHTAPCLLLVLSVSLSFPFVLSQNLILRACLISKIEGVAHLHALQKLELYDNQIGAIASVETLVNLTTLDLSFNCIRSMAPVSTCCPLLEELYIAQNKLRKIEGLEGLTRLRVLDLGANRIRVSEAVMCAG